MGERVVILLLVALCYSNSTYRDLLLFTLEERFVIYPMSMDFKIN